MKPAAITLWPFIIYSPKRITNKMYEPMLINHERIHLAQQRELWVIGFYILYIYYFLKKFKRHKDFFTAYCSNCFELEAYYNDTNMSYLKNRQPHAWKRYL